jgi:hypothetical protein
MNAIQAHQMRHEPSLMALPNVVGVGIGKKYTDGMLASDHNAIVIMVKEKLPPAAFDSPYDLVPPYLSERIPTDVIQVGDIKALQDDKLPTDKWRPAPGGVSIGHYKITAGTFGTVVKDKETGKRVILSNNHVLANSNDAVVGDSILQPGPHDGGSEPGDKIGTLGRFVRIDFGVDDSLCPIAQKFVQLSNFGAKLIGSSHRVMPYQEDNEAVNEVDAAYAIPTNDEDILDVIWGGIGVIDGVVEGTLGMDVAKFGRTTFYTEGVINLINATIRVSYGGLKIATFRNQFVAGAMSAGGDSGSLVIQRGTTSAVGLLFAGSDQSTIFSPIQLVLDSLDVEF